jgi:apolipoprotein N-acyltransferase
MIRYISITGTLGISFWVVLSSGFLFYLVNDNDRRYLIGGLLALLIFPAWSLLLKAFYVPPLEPPKLEVAIIQPNFDSYYRFGGYRSQAEALDVIFEVSDSVRTNQTGLIIWPENSIDSNVRLYSRITNRIADSARVWGSDFLVGSGFVKEYVDEESLPVIYRQDEDFKYNIYNSSIFVNRKTERDFYEKRSLVPMVERVPFADFLAKIDRLGMFDWGSITGFGKGFVPTNFTVNPQFITPGLVCYDSVFPGWVRDFVRGGATFITIITNDGWWGNTSGHHQHFAYARLRAIEFDRWVTRAANNGISGVIAPDGSVVEKTEYWERTGINASVEAKRSRTFYSKYGDWFPMGGGIIAVLIWFYGYVKDPVRKTVSQS